jgi:integrase
MLTDTKIRNARPRQKPYKLTDSAGLYLHIQPSGARYWRLKYRFGGREKVLALGVYPGVSLKQARAGRDSAKETLAAGQDPVLIRKRERRDRETAAANTFETLAREWLDHQCNRWIPDHSARVLHSLEVDIFPALGTLPITDVTAQELLAALKRIEKRGATETAHRVLQRCSAVFRYGIASGRCPGNPAADLRGALKPHKRNHRAALSEKQLAEFFGKLKEYTGRPETRIGLRLIALTFVRPGELRAAEWSEFDVEKAEWRIPAARMKMRAPHIVPLSRQAIEALEELRPLTGSGQLLFPNQSEHDRPMSENTLLYALYRMGYHSRATAHGFRATASTILNEQGFRPDVIERQLAHAERNKVRAAYHRSEYLEERRVMMQHWADYLDGLAGGAKVVPIKAGKGKRK